MTTTDYKSSVASLLDGMLSAQTTLEDIQVVGISLDSRQIKSGWLFVSLATNDAQRFCYVQQALSQGAKAVIFERDLTLTEAENFALNLAEVPVFFIKNLADKTGEIAARFYGYPSLTLTVVAVTGTNGKTSVSQFIAQALEFLGQPCGVVGTLGVGRVNDLKMTGMTTPDPITLQAILADFCQQSIKYAVIEASSHALDQGRLNSVAIDVAVLTNLSRDHLDYHQNMAEYAAAKKRLFDFSSIKAAVVNSLDDFGQTLIEDLVKRPELSVLTYSSQNDYVTAIQATDIVSIIEGLNFNISSDFGDAKIQSSLIGRFNVDNILAAATCLLAMNISFEDVVSSIQQCHAVDGRMQVYGENHQTHVVIDFAHTPDALSKALQSLRSHVPAKGQLWCVFGAGGDRDTGKRPLMGRAAELNADVVVLTDDNPRSEESAAIIDDILTGFIKPEKAYIEHDRKLAITYAISTAKSRDVVLVAGKGHEQYQEILGIKHPFNDAHVVTKVLKAANDEMQLTADIKR